MIPLWELGRVLGLKAYETKRHSISICNVTAWSLDIHVVPARPGCEEIVKQSIVICYLIVKTFENIFFFNFDAPEALVLSTRLSVIVKSKITNWSRRPT